jgi:hypothetical protein
VDKVVQPIFEMAQLLEQLDGRSSGTLFVFCAKWEKQEI